MVESRLPPAFVDLETHLERWALPNTVARMQARDSANMADIEAFYGALVPRLPAALDYLQGIAYGAEMAACARNLVDLCLSIAEIPPAVEWYGQPRVIDGYAGSVLTITSELP